jgi:protein-arginine kinase activator protein McsA
MIQQQRVCDECQRPFRNNQIVVRGKFCVPCYRHLSSSIEDVIITRKFIDKNLYQEKGGTN